ncbi:MAG TPA: hypothetical protein VIG99_01830 [Myxococcaceae bacterium]
MVRGNTGPSYSDLDAAAVAACDWLWAHQSEAKRWEYCGVLYREEAGGGIRVGLPERGDRAWRCFPRDPPEATVFLGRYHNHRFTAEPSGDDKKRAQKEPSLGHYLCAPSGLVRRISAKEGTVNVR